MGFEKGDAVVLRDKHSDHDGEVGEVSQVSETMFGDNTYIVQFDEGQEAGIPAEALDAAEE
jgi:beta-lactamase superfamily II metal-dependent hydrolase